jgi:hypothetical protein
MALTLSQYTRVVLRKGVRSSVSNCCNQEASAIALAIAPYSASALEWETVFWHLEDQEMRLSPRKTA